MRFVYNNWGTYITEADFALLEGVQYFHTLQDLLQSLQTIDAQQVADDGLRVFVISIEDKYH